MMTITIWPVMIIVCDNNYKYKTSQDTVDDDNDCRNRPGCGPGRHDHLLNEVGPQVGKFRGESREHRLGHCLCEANGNTYTLAVIPIALLNSSCDS
jgi:hypothetical protein